MSTTHVHGGADTTGLLLVAFVVLKLVGVIDWSWWWVLSPIWIPALAVLAILLVAVAIIAVKELIRL